MKTGKMVRRKLSNVHFSMLFFRLFLRLLYLTFPAWGIVFCIVILLGVLFSVVERTGLFYSLYFTFITAMTVGYGDITPNTDIGKVLSVCMGISGIVTTGIIVAVALQALRMAFEKSHDIDGQGQNNESQERGSL